MTEYLVSAFRASKYLIVEIATKAVVFLVMMEGLLSKENVLTSLNEFNIFFRSSLDFFISDYTLSLSYKDGEEKILRYEKGPRRP